MSDVWLSKPVYSVFTIESETLKHVFIEYILCSRKCSKSLILFSLMLTTSLTGRYYYDACSTGKAGKAHKGQTCIHGSQESHVADQGRCLSPYALPLVTQLSWEASLPRFHRLFLRDIIISWKAGIISICLLLPITLNSPNSDGHTLSIY